MEGNSSALAETLGREQWLRERRSGLGGSDVAAILGISPFNTALDVWLDKRGEKPDLEQTEAMWWGHALEDAMAQRYALETGSTCINPSRIFRHREYDFLLGTPDRLVVNFSGEVVRGLEIKVPGSRDGWGEPGTDEVPDYYLVQCCHYMAVCDVNAWDVAAFFGVRDFRRYTLERDRDLEAGIIPRLVEWWERFMLNGDRPPIDGSDSTRRWLQARFPVEAAPMMPANDLARAIGAKLGLARLEIDRHEEIKRECENLLKDMMGEAAGIEGVCSWKRTRNRHSVDHEALSAFAMDSLETLGFFDGPNEKRDAVVARFTVEKPGTRRFLYTAKD
jgi:putative phage-type endonuclease